MFFILDSMNRANIVWISMHWNVVVFGGLTSVLENVEYGNFSPILKNSCSGLTDNFLLADRWHILIRPR
jgi:hypothetical protein